MKTAATETILRRTDQGGSVEYVYLNWSAGDRSGAKDWYKLSYDQVSSPSVASNAALETLLRQYAETVNRPDITCQILWIAVGRFVPTRNHF